MAISNEEYRQQAALSTQQGLFEAGMATAERNVQLKQQAAAQAEVEEKLTKYAANTGESSVQHRARLLRILKDKVVAQATFAKGPFAQGPFAQRMASPSPPWGPGGIMDDCLTEAVEVVQSALKATDSLKGQLDSKRSEADQLEIDLREQIEEGKAEVAEIESLESNIKSLDRALQSQDREIRQLRGSLFVVSFSMVWLSCFFTPQLHVLHTLEALISLHFKAAVLSGGVVAILFFYNWATALMRGGCGSEDGATPAHDLAEPDIGSTGSVQIDPGSLKRLERLQERISAFYQKWNPTKLEDRVFVSKLAQKYVDNETQLFEKLCKQYGPEPSLTRY